MPNFVCKAETSGPELPNPITPGSHCLAAGGAVGAAGAGVVVVGVACAAVGVEI